MKMIDITGQKFSRLTVIERTANSKAGKSMWICTCDCNGINQVIAVGSDLRSGKTKSCGCYRRDRASKEHRTHGLRKSPIYAIWCGIKKRCYNQNEPSYKNYGGRGIKMCGQWLADFISFYEWAVLSGYEKGLTIDRIDNDGNYEPSNCRWATRKEQCRNRRSNINVEIDGSTKTLTEWCEVYGIKIGITRYLMATRNIDAYAAIELSARRRNVKTSGREAFKELHHVYGIKYQE